MDCERCKKRECLGKWKYCKECKAIVMKELREEGYLQPKPFGHAGDGRTSEMRENTYQTKHGTGH